MSFAYKFLLFFIIVHLVSAIITQQDPAQWSAARIGWEIHSQMNVSLGLVIQNSSSTANGSSTQRRRSAPNGSSAGRRRSTSGLTNLAKRQSTGALYCTSGPCIDGSCCGPAGICGYGPDFCGDNGCTSNCNSTAMCGIYSEGGAVACGMELCCSASGWCGTTEDYCVGPDQYSPCQEGYGKCEIVTPTTCGEDSGTATGGRTIGYYQAANNRDRLCNVIAPSQILTDGYTHLYFAFASIDPSTYEITPADPGDVDLMYEFTALKTSTMETWIAIGGFDFSDVGPTHTTWSDICADSSKRSTFISSVQNYMETYGFQGVDIDWEYPVAPDRGGSPGDTENFVSLLSEMRTAFGSDYGISVTLAPDYWYLRYFDAISMEPYVDWFGFMAYDLHGYWDADIPTLGALVRGQSDIREISNDVLPLFFDELDPSKINLGIALYGRGYTLTDPACNTLGCPFSGPNIPAPCTNTPGVMSLTEIQQMIAEYGYEANLLEDAAMMEVTWDDQWIGYDDFVSIAIKKQFANNMCFGGTMAWSVDFDSGNGSISSVGYVDPDIWTGSDEPEVTCEAPCILVLPPYPLDGTQTVSWPSLTTTLMSSSAGVVYVVTTTISIAPFPITDVSFEPVTLQPTDTGTYTINLVQSITPPSFILTLPPNEATFPPTTPTPPATSTTSGGVLLVIPPGVTFPTTYSPVTIQPQPTYSVPVEYPPPGPPGPPGPPPITVKPGPNPPGSCTGVGCGTHNCGIFGCGGGGGGCGLFSCNGGCRIFGCGGGCGPLGCSPSCGLASCGGLGCTVPGGCGNTEGPGGSDSGNECEEPLTATACTYIVTSYSIPPMADYETVTSTVCETTTACDVENSVTTTTVANACTLDAADNAYYSSAMASGEGVYNGQQIPWQYYPEGGTVDAGFTITEWGLDTPITVISSAPVTLTPTTTYTFMIPPAVSALCVWYNVGPFWTFEIYNIDGWSTDGGAALHKQEDGCIALTGWDWHEPDDGYSYPRVYFNLPITVDPGCVERAIVSAGGPMISCSELPLPSKRKREQPQIQGRNLVKRDEPNYPDFTWTPSYTYPASTTLPTAYVPMTWGSGSTVTLTETFTTTSYSVGTTTITWASSTPSTVASPDGSCGETNGYVCTGSGYGDCCSASGYCGSTTAYCSTGCQSDFGTCAISPDGSCGGTNGYICTGSGYGDCCSASGYCGSTTTYCSTGCQSDFGSCGISPDGSCGGINGFLCTGSGYGDCCSASGYCGSTTAYCSTGCQSDFGSCAVSPDGSCGGTNGYLCIGSGYGDCCSASGYCGSTTGYCSTGCQTAFGSCAVSPDGTCGGTNGYFCTGSGYGDCCSANGYCGDTADYCSTGSCQIDFGTCNSGVPVSTDGTCGSNSAVGATCEGSSYGNCCSASGYCGSTSAYCSTGCQLSYGSCAISTDGTCGGMEGYLCGTSAYGNCCSASGYCGSTSDYCGTGCQTSYGWCT